MVAITISNSKSKAFLDLGSDRASLLNDNCPRITPYFLFSLLYF